MLDGTGLEGVGAALVMLDVHHFHIEEVDLPLLDLELGKAILPRRLRHLHVHREAVFLLLYDVDYLFDAGWVFFSKLKADVSAHEEEYLGIRFAHFFDHEAYQIEDEAPSHSAKEEEVQEAIDY